MDNGLQPAARLTVGAYLDDWVSGLDHRVRPNTADQYRFTVRCHLRPALATKTLAKLTVADCNALWAAKLTKGFKPNTVRLMRAVLRRATRRRSQRARGPQRGRVVERARVESLGGRSLTAEQARALLSAAKGDRLEVAYLLALTLGLRRGELLGLAWADVDTDAATIQVRQQVTVRKSPQGVDGKRSGPTFLELSQLKTGSKGRRTLELTPELVDALRSQWARQAAEHLLVGEGWFDSGLVFTTPVGTPIEPGSFSHAFTAMAESAGLGRWHLHETRHSAASLMLAMGTRLEVVSRILGHSSVTITMDTYGHLLGGENRAAAAAMCGVLLGSG